MTPQAIIEWVKAALAAVLAVPEVRFILAHIAVNVVVAVAAALKTGDFQLSKLGEFLYRKALPYALVYFVCKYAGEAASLGWLAPVAFAALEANLVGDLVDNAVRLGLQLPDNVARFFVKA